MQTASPDAQSILARTPLRKLAPMLEKLALAGLSQAQRGVASDSPTYFDDLLRNLSIEYSCPAEELDHVRTPGPLIIVGNHPFGLAEGIVLGSILSKLRPDMRFVANSFLTIVPGLKTHLIPVDPFGGEQAIHNNRRPLRRSIEWLKSGGALVLFPAGEVATVRFPEMKIEEGVWNPSIARLAQIADATILPVFFHGANSPAFHLAGMIHPRLRTMLIPRELLLKAGARIKLSVGLPISPARLTGLKDPTAYVRARTLMLGARDKRPAPLVILPARQAKIAAPQNPQTIERELEALPAEQELVRQNEFSVYYASAGQIPHALLEIGHLRETTFRLSGEGTGKSIDLDRFDRHYSHLIMWDRKERAIVGSYRFVKTDEVIAESGVRGLYTNTLFHLKPGFYQGIRPAIELGRSFVRVEYQKSFSPLLLLWKGIGHYVARNPRYRYLFGPVSISQDYSSSSRDLMVSFVKTRCGNNDLAAHVAPRKPFRSGKTTPCDAGNFTSLLSDIDELSEIVGDIEPDGKKIPVLLRHYLNLGGQILDFNTDKKFSSVVDGLVVLDLAKVNRRQLDRYMGKENAEAFLLEHKPAAITAA